MENKPFYQETLKLFESVAKHDLNSLADLCDDDFGIVDLNEEGKNIIIRTREEWEDWFKTLFAKLDNMNARTWTEVTNYEAVQDTSMGYSVVDFDQLLEVADKKLRFSCITTIIWKKTPNGWKEARYHSSLLGVREDEK